MVARLLRLTTAHDFDRIYRKGRKIGKKGVSFFVFRQPNHSSSIQFSCIVPNRILSKATKRNTVKRWIRALILSKKTQLRGYQIIIKITEPPLPFRVQTIRSSILQLIETLTDHETTYSHPRQIF